MDMYLRSELRRTKSLQYMSDLNIFGKDAADKMEIERNAKRKDREPKKN